jgi:hypothetical protein
MAAAKQAAEKLLIPVLYFLFGKIFSLFGPLSRGFLSSV